MSITSQERDYFTLALPVATKIFDKLTAITDQLHNRELHLYQDKLLYYKQINENSGDSLTIYVTERVDAESTPHHVVMINTEGLTGNFTDSFRFFTFEEISTYCPGDVLESAKQTETNDKGMFLKCNTNTFKPMLTRYNATTELSQQSLNFCIQNEIAKLASNFPDLNDEKLSNYLTRKEVTNLPGDTMSGLFNKAL